MTIEEEVRQQMQEEIGEEDNLTYKQKTGLLQKYGLINPIIDKNIMRPEWVSKKDWQKREGTWRAIINKYRGKK